MRWRKPLLLLSILACDSAAQVIDFPCVPRFRADKSYIQTSEGSGGQILMLDTTEIASPAITRVYASGADQTILRAAGTLGAGFQEFTAPVDSGARLAQFKIFAECVKSIVVTAPSGEAVEGTRLTMGRIVTVEKPETGVWRVKLAGTGYFSAVAEVKGGVSLAPLQLEGGIFTAFLSGAETAEFRLLSRSGALLGTIPVERNETRYTGALTAPAEAYHIAVEGTDKAGAAFRRLHAPLLAGGPAK
ncbi:MAG TPA: hypothetical protein VL285_09980 [Bryobacteraceae bacterium]|jgi:hypothetical protein|nr:hypothetical protein [Bryobacteraceae bacterium]